jgi:putative endonuclease
MASLAADRALTACRKYVILSAAKDLAGMSWDRRYYVYLMASHSRVLYIGVTSDLRRRVYQHKHGLIQGFSSQYRVTRLVYYEDTPNSRAAVEQERLLRRSFATLRMTHP